MPLADRPPSLLNRWRAARGPALRWLLGAAAVAASARYLARALGPALSQARAGALGPAPSAILMALGLFTLGLGLGALSWWLVLRACGARLDAVECLAVHALSSLGKYLPGSVWPYVGKAVLTRRLGAPSGAVGLAVGVELVSLIVSGAALGLIAAPPQAVAAWGAWAGARWPGAAAGAALLAALPWLIGWAREWAGAWRGPGGARPQAAATDDAAAAPAAIAPLWLYAAHAAMIAGWLANGLALGALLRGLGAAPPPGLASYAVTLGYLAGLLVLFVPVGLGVREAALVWLLAPGVAPAQAAAAALWARLLATAAEPLALGLTLALRQWRRAARPKDLLP